MEILGVIFLGILTSSQRLLFFSDVSADYISLKWKKSTTSYNANINILSIIVLPVDIKYFRSCYSWRLHSYLNFSLQFQQHLTLFRNFKSLSFNLIQNTSVLSRSPSISDRMFWELIGLDASQMKTIVLLILNFIHS